MCARVTDMFGSAGLILGEGMAMMELGLRFRFEWERRRNGSMLWSAL